MSQLTLPIAARYSYHADEFIISPSNQSAYNILSGGLQWCGVKPYEFATLLYGPSSSGKTYLTKIWQATTNAYLLRNGQGVDEQILHHYPAFILEDIDKEGDEETLLHYFNLINESGGRLLLTTSNLNNNFKLKDLSSRINSLYRATISQPDDELVKALLFKHFSGNSLKVENSVLEFLLKHLPRQFDKIIEVASKINHFALTHKRSVTIPLVKKVVI